MNNYKIQSILINNNKNNLSNAIKWVIDHNFKISKIDQTDNYFRIRQFSPDELEKKGYSKYYSNNR